MQRLAVKKTKTKAQSTTLPSTTTTTKRKLTTKPFRKTRSRPSLNHTTTTNSIFSTKTTIESATTSLFDTDSLAADHTTNTTAGKNKSGLKRAKKLSMMDQITTLSQLFSHHKPAPSQLLDALAATTLAPLHPLSPQGPLRKLKMLLAQQTMMMAAALGLASDKTPDVTDTPPPSALSPTDLPTTLPPPVNPLKKLHSIDGANAAGIETTTAASDAITLNPVMSDFIPPTPSRTIPIIHDGIEWDEPNFLFRPFIHAIDLLHEHTGLPWWATLVTWAWILRTSISPLTYKQQASSVKLTLLQPDIMRIGQELRQLDPKSNSYKTKQQEMTDLYKKNGVGPFTSIFWSMASIPFYVLSFIGIRNMANSPYFASEFSTGGFFPYTNLTASAGWELALVNALVNLVVIHVSSPVPIHKMAKLQKIMFGLSHVLILGFIPILSNINTGSLMYFIANNSFSIFFQALFYTNTFRKVAGLPTNAEVSAVRDLVTEMQAQQSNARSAGPSDGRKNAYVLDSETGKKVQLGQPDVLAQARSMVSKKEAEKKTFAIGGAAAVQEARLQAEKDAVAAKDAAAQAQAVAAMSNEDKAFAAKQQRLNDFKNGVVPGKNTYQIQDNGPKPERVGGAKVVNRKNNWKKH